MSLAMYTELAAHLGQITSVNTELHGQDAVNFDYNDSQIAAISISYGDQVDQDLVQKILDHYGTWQKESETKDPKPDLLLQM